MIKFKSIRSTVSRIFTESQQMKIVICISDIFWFLRKYFLAVDIDYSKEFINNWKKVKPESSLDRERNFTLYQLLNIHNNSFKNEETNIIEFGVSRGSSLITICNFIKKNSNIFGIDSFGIYAEEIKKLSTSNVDQNYQGSQIAFNKRTRFKNFNTQKLYNNILEQDNFKDKRLFLIECHFPDNLKSEDWEKISNRKYSFAYIDFDLSISIYDALEFIIPKLEKKAILLIDDYNMINQEGCKAAVKKFGLDEKRCFQTSGGQLVFFNGS